MDLRREPHHDGSALYVLGTPEVGTSVTVRLRVDASDPIAGVWLRWLYDAEPVFTEAVRSEDGDGVWFSAALLLHSPMNTYRFLIARADGSQVWLTAAGVVDHDVADTFDFKISTHAAAPQWSTRTVVYQIFPDRFARSAAADSRPVPSWAKPQAWDSLPAYSGDDDRTWLGLYGGDLDGITEHLDHVRAVGADTVYLTPVFPAESNHRYNASTFDSIDPLLGGNDAYARLAGALHDSGMHLIGDLTSNHTGDTHEWFIQALAGGPTRDFYYFNPDGSYECWGGYPTLPKLDHTNPAVRDAVVAVVQRWMASPWALDGWRIDVANMTGRFGAIDVNHQVARQIRAAIESVNPDGWLIGEHNHDASGDIDGDGWHGTMNYSGFSWPIWSWLRSPDTAALAFGRPLQVPRRSGIHTVAALREWRARYGWRAASQSWNILSSHDSARIRTIVGSARSHWIAAALQFTLPGVPMVFAGDEIGLEGVLGEDGRRTMPWQAQSSWDQDTLSWYAGLAALRRTSPALIGGGLRWTHVSEDEIGFLREHHNETIHVMVNRATDVVDGVDGVSGVQAGEVLLAADGVRITRV